MEQRKLDNKISFFVVDDEPDYGETLLELININLGLNGKYYSNPLEALEHFNDDLAFVITDYHMPELKGEDLIKEIRKKSKTPLILISGKLPIIKGSTPEWDNVFIMEKTDDIKKVKYYIKCCLAVNKKSA